MNISKETDLITLAQYYVDEKNKTKINESIKENFLDDVGEPSIIHDLICNMPISSIWTTNYDTLLEIKFNEIEKGYNVITNDQSYKNVDPKKPVNVYKIHGTYNDPSNCILTKDDYEKFNSNHNIVLAQFNAELCSKSFLFLGYGFKDNDLNYVFSKIREIYDDAKPFQHYCIMKKISKEEDDYKYLSTKQDLFEAIVGAVTIDCNWDMDTITDVVEAMIDIDSYFENYDDTDDNYVGELQEWMQQNELGLPNYKYEENDNSFVCFLIIKEINGFTGKGASKAQARRECAANAYSFLKEKGYIRNEYIEAVGDADCEQALRQLNELKQKGLISEPDWEEELSYDKNGNPIWTVKLIIPELDYCFVEENSSKKEAKRLCAYDLLCELMYEDG